MTHHLHLIEVGEKDWEDKLKFKNILLTYPKVVQEYEALKQQLSRRFPEERRKYTEGKAAFIQSVLTKYL